MGDVYIDALQNYLSSSEFRGNMEMFVGANCMQFHNTNGEYTKEHYELWKNFQDIVENILEMALMNVGGSIETLEKVLDDIAFEEGAYNAGPKHGALVDIVKQLLSYESFEAFCEMMVTAARYKKEENQRLNSNNLSGCDEDDATLYYINALTNMGYLAEHIDIVLSSVEPNKTSLEELLSRLHELTSGFQASDKSSVEGYGSEAKDASLRLSTDANDDYYHPAASDDPYENYRSYCLKFAELLVSMKEYYDTVSEEEPPVPIPTDDRAELDSKFVMAQSVLDNFNQGFTGSDVVPWLAWATNMLELLGDIEAAYYADLALNDGSDKDAIAFDQYVSDRAPDGLGLQYAYLEDMRLKVEEEVGEAISGHNEAEAKRVAALKAIADLGSENEQLLHHLITRHEEVQKEISSLHKKCSLFVSSHNFAVKRENIEELYLFLKEKVQSGVQISPEMAEEMHELVYHTTMSQSSPELAMEVLALLLELNVSEDEEMLLRQRIQEMVGASPPKRAEAPKLFEESETETKEWSDGTNEVRTSDVADSKDVAPNNSKPSEPTNAADSKVNSSYSGNNSQEKESKPEVKEQKVEAKIDVAPLLPKPDVDDHFLKMMKEKHMESLTGLKGKLKVEKDRRLQELEDRLMRRKLARKKLLSEGGGTANKEDLEFDEELEKQIQETQVHMEKVEEGLVNGLKKKCLFEMKALKAKGGGTPLTDEEKRIADRLAGQELIKRYERDQKNLLTSLEAQRIKQKNKILERAKLKAAKNKNASNPEGVDDEVAIELQQIDEYFKEQISNAVLEPQNFMFLGLSAINSDVAEEDADNKPNGEDDDDDYFDDDKNSHKKDIKSWINGIEYMTGKYATACKSMQEKLIEAHYEQQANIHEIVDPQKAAIEDGFVDLSGHMLKVLSDAYNKHSHEGDQQDDDYKYGHGKKKSDMDDRIKSGIVNEFEKSKENYNDILSKQRETGKQRLKERRKNKTGAKEECNDVVGAFESMIDSFLEAPTAVSPSQPQPVIRNVPPSSLPTMKDGGQFTTPKTLPPIASKTVLPPVESTNDKGLSASDMRKLHMEKERSLMDTLNTQMIQKKRTLDDRLKRKREQRIKTEELQSESGIENARVGIAQQEEAIAEAEVARLQAGYENVLRLIRETDANDMNRVDMEGVMKLLDKSVEGDVAKELPKFEKSSQNTMEHVAANHKATQDAAEQKNKIMLEDEVKRISNNYSEEKQKLDLTMKIEQARQRAVLQRKLLAKKQGGESSSSNGADVSIVRRGGGAGYSSTAPMQGMNIHSSQESFRIPNTMNVVPVGINRGISHRGMNATPMMRK